MIEYTYDDFNIHTKETISVYLRIVETEQGFHHFFRTGNEVIEFTHPRKIMPSRSWIKGK